MHDVPVMSRSRSIRAGTSWRWFHVPAMTVHVMPIEADDKRELPDIFGNRGPRRSPGAHRGGLPGGTLLECWPNANLHSRRPMYQRVADLRHVPDGCGPQSISPLYLLVVNRYHLIGKHSMIKPDTTEVLSSGANHGIRTCQGDIYETHPMEHAD